MRDTVTYPVWRAIPTPTMPVEKMVVGQRVEDAAVLLPRLFNLCRVAQGLAARAAFGLPLTEGWRDELRREILREHVMKLCLKWPALLSMPALPLPRNWSDGGAEMPKLLFGPTGQLPEEDQGVEAFLSSEDGVAPLLRKLSQLFAPFEACRGVMPAVATLDFFAAGPLENSVGARQSQHPALQFVEKRWGRGPLWSATALAYDLQDVLQDRIPQAHFAAGCAVVPAARGLYGVKAQVEDGRVTAFFRVTPTDHLLAERGALAQALASLPGQRAEALAPLVMAILDPCHPVRLEQTQEREQACA